MKNIHFKTEFYHDILTPGTMRLFGSTERGITKKYKKW